MGMGETTIREVGDPTRSCSIFEILVGLSYRTTRSLISALLAADPASRGAS